MNSFCCSCAAAALTQPKTATDNATARNVPAFDDVVERG
jgi:hypothetical protein